jgi:hypothetical protein
MSKDLNYQKILNVHVYALGKEGDHLPTNKKQIFLDNLVSKKLDQKSNTLPRGKLESQVSFEEDYPRRRTFHNSEKQTQSQLSLKKKSGWKESGIKESDLRETKNIQDDLTESALRRKLTGKLNPSGRTIKPNVYSFGKEGDLRQNSPYEIYGIYTICLITF